MRTDRDRVLIVLGGGEVDTWIAVMNFVVDYCKAHDYGDVRVRNGEHGHEVFIPAKPAPAIDFQI